MALDLTVPQLGESITEAVVGKWHKQVGESVAIDEPVVVLETDKVTIDVPAPAAGAIAAIARKEGDRVKVGEVLGSITPGAAAAPVASAKSAPPAAAPAPAATAAPKAEAAPARATQLTPVARRVVEEHGLDPARIRGSGPGGRIQKDDVLGAIEKPAQPPPAQQQQQPTPAPAAPRPPSERGEERVRMTPLRKRVAERLLSAQANAAILTTFN